ncbi:MAG: dienelactone hydrolase family protein [Pirellulales bacterium]|nr:dienelactone hydrolase family protein [Pirellulales bacterium]
MRLILVVCAVFLFQCMCVGIAHAANPNDFQARSYTDSGTGNTLPYRLFIPLNYDPQEQYPLVLFLHGAGESGTQNDKQINGNIDNLFNHVKTPEYSSFLLAPQTNSGWYTGGASLSSSLFMTMEVIQELEAEFSIDHTRRYVTGLSMGGGGTFDMVCKRPDSFAAAVPICGYGDPGKAGALVHQPIWAFHAANDGTVPVENTQNMIAAIQAAGGNPLYTEYATGGHGIWGTVYNTPELYDWMYAQATPEPSAATMLLVGFAMMLGLRVARRQK